MGYFLYSFKFKKFRFKHLHVCTPYIRIWYRRKIIFELSLGSTGFFLFVGHLRNMVRYVYFILCGYYESGGGGWVSFQTAEKMRIFSVILLFQNNFTLGCLVVSFKDVFYIKIFIHIATKIIYKWQNLTSVTFSKCSISCICGNVLHTYYNVTLTLMNCSIF